MNNSKAFVAAKLRWIIDEYYEGKYSRLATAIDEDPTTIKKILDETREDAGRIGRKILELHPELSAEWWMRDQVEKYRDMSEDKQALIKEKERLQAALNSIQETLGKLNIKF